MKIKSRVKKKKVNKLKDTKKKKHNSDNIEDKKGTVKHRACKDRKDKKDSTKHKNRDLNVVKKDSTEHGARVSHAETRGRASKINKENGDYIEKSNITTSTTKEKSINKEKVVENLISISNEKQPKQLSSTLRNAAILKYTSMCEDIATGKIKVKERPQIKIKVNSNVMQNNKFQEEVKCSMNTGLDLDQIELPAKVKPAVTSPKAILKNLVGSITQSVLATAQNFYPQIPKNILYPVSSGANLHLPPVSSSVQTLVSKAITANSTSKISTKPPSKEKQTVNLQDFIEKQSEEISNIQQLVWMRSEYNKMLAVNPNNYDVILEKSVIDFKIQEWEKAMAQNKPKMVKKNGIYVVDSPYDLPQDYMMLPHKYQPSEYALKLMAKMGWNQGKTLGKEEKDLHSVPPLRVEIKNDRIGLGTLCEMYTDPELRDVLNKNPISALQELCQKKKWPIPEYVESSLCPFVTKVTIRGRSFVPTTKSNSKKSAKCEAARYALECMGFKVANNRPVPKPQIYKTVQAQNVGSSAFQPQAKPNFDQIAVTTQSNAPSPKTIGPSLDIYYQTKHSLAQTPFNPVASYQAREIGINAYNQQQFSGQCSHRMTPYQHAEPVFHPSPSVINHSSLATENGLEMPQQNYNSNIVRPPLPPHMLINQWNST